MAEDAMAMAGGTRSWTARADSVAAVEMELGRIWGAAAGESRRAHLSAQGLAASLGDPHLAGRLDVIGDVGVSMRTSVLTLVVVAERPETEQRVLGAIGRLAARHPSRTIILAPGDPDGPAHFDARIFADCRIAQRSGAESCTERILLRTGGEADQHLSNLVQPLLIHDLPVLLWWPDHPPFGRPRFEGLVGSCDRLLVDTTAFRDDGGAGFAALGALGERLGRNVHDIGWMRIRPWRELLASLFDGPLMAAELGHAATLRIDVVGRAGHLRPALAILYAGWLAAALGWHVAAPLGAGDAGTLEGCFRAGRRTVKFEVRPVKGPAGERSMAGAMEAVELTLERPGWQGLASIVRSDDHLMATATDARAVLARRAAPIDPADDAHDLAAALEQGGPDRMLGRAIAVAAELLGG
ncbi:MAG: glucose-6-phosphate dehydrogenase assembly protein OpcA [Candidatus Limnocylindrales bacterium]